MPAIKAPPHVLSGNFTLNRNSAQASGLRFWAPMGASGLANVAIRRRQTSHVAVPLDRFTDGPARSFDASTSNVLHSLPGSVPTLYAISVWARRNTITGTFDILAGLQANYKGSLWAYENGNIAFGDASNTWGTWTGLWTDKSSFHHILVTLEGTTSTARLYFDGVDQGTKSTTGGVTSLSAVRIGQFSLVFGTSNFYGWMRDFRIYERSVGSALARDIWRHPYDLYRAVRRRSYNAVAGGGATGSPWYYYANLAAVR